MNWLKKVAEPETIRGYTFADLVFGAVKDAVAGWEELKDRNRVVVNEILMGGRFYNVGRAIYEVFGYSPLTGYVKIQSREEPGSTEGSVKFSHLVEGELMVVGDTVASGWTMERFLELVHPKELFLVTIGAREGIDRVKRAFRGKLHAKFIPWPTRLNPKNRTDMPLDVDSLPEDILEKLLEITTEDILRVQCIIGDFSDSIMNVPAFLAEWFAILAQLHAYLEWKGDRRGMEIVEKRGRRLVEDLLGWVGRDRAREMAAAALNRRQRLKGYEGEFTAKDIVLSVEEMGRRLEEHHWDEFMVWD